MNISSGDVVTIRHYSGTNLFKSIVYDVQNDIVEIKLTKDFVVFNFFEGDPVVLIYETNSTIYTASCSLVKVSTKQGTISLHIENLDQTSDNRKSERYAVSLYADVRKKGFQRKDTGTVRNISSEGMMICSKADFDIGEDLEVDLYIEKNLIFIKANVVWKTNKKHLNEYGLGLIFPNLQIRNSVRRHLEDLKNQQNEFIMDLKKSL